MRKRLASGTQDVNAPDSDGQSALRMAAIKDVSVNHMSCDHFQHSEYFRSVPSTSTSPRDVREILKYTRKVMHECDRTTRYIPCHFSLASPSLSQNVYMLDMLLQHGADISTPSPKDGNTAIHLAALWGREDAVKFLVEHDAVRNGGPCPATPSLFCLHLRSGSILTFGRRLCTHAHIFRT